LTIGLPSDTLKYVPNREPDLDRLFQALSAGPRRSIVDRLVRGPASVGELARPLTMSLPAVMQHLQVLEACGLVWTEKVGRTRTCHIAPARMREAEAWLASQRTAWERHLERLGDFLAEADSLPDPATDRSRHDRSEQKES